jgi:hypothetical protein
MLAKNLVKQITKRGGTAEIVERDMRGSVCQVCGDQIRKHNVLNMTGDDYDAWFSEDFLPRENPEQCKDGSAHMPAIEVEVVGELRGYDVHMYGDSNGYFTTRAISKRGEYDQGSDYNPGGWTFCNRLTDLDWACR